MSVGVSAPHELAKSFSQNGIQLNLQSDVIEGVLEELIDTVPSLANNPAAKTQLLRALVDREKLSSTAIGRGIAVPHARNSVALPDGRTSIVFGRHPTGVHFRAPDGAPVRLFFLLLAPTINLHLQALSRLARLLREPQLREELLSAAVPQEVIEAIANAEARVFKTGERGFFFSKEPEKASVL